MNSKMTLQWNKCLLWPGFLSLQKTLKTSPSFAFPKLIHDFLKLFQFNKKIASHVTPYLKDSKSQKQSFHLNQKRTEIVLNFSKNMNFKKVILHTFPAVPTLAFLVPRTFFILFFLPFFCFLEVLAAASITPCLLNLKKNKNITHVHTVLWGPLIKLIQVVSTSEFYRYWWNNIVSICCPR